MAVSTKKDLSQLRDLSGNKRNIAIGAVVLLIIFAIWSILLQTGVIGGPDVQAGYYVLQINMDPNATKDQQSENAVFGFERLALNGDGTFRLGSLRGNWRRSGSSVTLNPTALPSMDMFYPKTSMVQTLSIMLKSCDFSVSKDGKILTAVNPTNGPLVWTKVNEVFGK